MRTLNQNVKITTFLITMQILNPSRNWSKICNCAFALIECKMQQWLYYCRPKNKWNRWGENKKKFSTYLNHFSHFLSQRDSGTFCIWIHYLLEVDQNIPTLMSFEQGNSIENECNFPTLDFGLIFAKWILLPCTKWSRHKLKKIWSFLTKYTFRALIWEYVKGTLSKVDSKYIKPWLFPSI